LDFDEFLSILKQGSTISAQPKVEKKADLEVNDYK
jgi:hypothetical protein